MGVTGQVTATRAVTVEEIAAQLGETEQEPIRQLTRAQRIRCGYWCWSRGHSFLLASHGLSLI